MGIHPLAARGGFGLCAKPGAGDRFIGVGTPGLGAFYAPVIWVYKHAPPFRLVLDKYMGVWDKNW